MKNIGNWSYWYSNETSSGVQSSYQCNISKRRGNQCPSRIYFLYLPNSQHVLLFIKNHDHEHQNITNNGIKDKEVARRIQELYKLGVS